MFRQSPKRLAQLFGTEISFKYFPSPCVPWAIVACMLFLSRLIIYVAGMSIHVRGPLIQRWVRWDSVHYLSLASYGYEYPGKDLSFASRFPPLFPYAIRVFEKCLPISQMAAAIICANTFFLFSGLLLFRLAVAECGRRETGYWCVAMFAFFPTSYFFSIPYSESVYVFLLIAYFAILRHRPSLSMEGILAACLILTRFAGWFVIPLHLLRGYLEFRRSRAERGAMWPILLACIFPIVIGASFHGYITYITHQPGYFAKGNAISEGRFKPFVQNISALKKIYYKPSELSNRSFMTTQGWSSIFILSFWMVWLHSLKRLPWPYHFYFLIYGLFLATISFPISAPRLCLAWLPIFIFLACIPSRGVKLLILSGFTLALSEWSKQFVTGAWTF